MCMTFLDLCFVLCGNAATSCAQRDTHTLPITSIHTCRKYNGYTRIYTIKIEFRPAGPRVRYLQSVLELNSTRHMAPARMYPIFSVYTDTH